MITENLYFKLTTIHYRLIQLVNRAIGELVDYVNY